MDYTFDQKLKHFQVCVERHMLNAADYLLLRAEDAFELGALRLVAVYFESIAKYYDGFDRDGESDKYFLRGWHLVLPHAKEIHRPITDDHFEGMYKLVRCALYHGAIPPLDVVLSVSPSLAFAGTKEGKVIIGPTRLVGLLRSHFKSYLERLGDVSETELRGNFEKRWDFEANYGR